MYNIKVNEIFSLPVQDGDFGVEIEMCGRSINNPLPRGFNRQKNGYWSVHDDGSLRGVSTAEYVLRKPLNKDDLKNALEVLGKKLNDPVYKAYESIYAGTHVHLNCQNYTMKEVAKIITIYYCVEKLLLTYSGKYREGNHFCLGAEDANFIVDFISNNFSKRDWGSLTMSRFKYAALNLSSLSKFGSLEFRSFKSTPNMKEVYDWCMILNNMKEAALKFDSPRDIVLSISMNGVDKFISDTFKEYSDIFLKYENLFNMVYDGIRNAQDIAYGVDWDIKEQPIKTGPVLNNPNLHGNIIQVGLVDEYFDEEDLLEILDEFEEENDYHE